MRLIDADKLESGEVIIPTENGGYEYVEVFYKDDVDNAPSVDAVEVVRCKDCIHKPRGTRNKHDMEFPDEICPCQCEDYWYSWMPDDDWFCANGERREDETD